MLSLTCGCPHTPDEKGHWSASEPTADHRRSLQIYCPPQECAVGGGGEVRYKVQSKFREVGDKLARDLMLGRAGSLSRYLGNR